MRATMGAAVMLAASTALAADASRDAQIRLGLKQLHEENFEEALGTSQAMRERWPDDPAGYVAAANVYQTMMRDYRVRAFEQPFESMLGQALAVADRAVSARPTAESLFARGTARAYRAVHRFTQGEWIPALFDAVRGVGDARRAIELDPTFADPVLATAVHDFWKGEKLGMGLGLFRGGRRTVVSRLERVRAEARFVGVEAAYSLQIVHYRQGDLSRALEVNDWLYARFPRNPVCLYHRALIFEGLARQDEALSAWDALVLRIQSSPHRSDGFLAECHLHRARLLEGRAVRGQADAGPAAAAARREATEHAGRRVADRELEGPLTAFDEVRRQIERLGPTAPRTAGR